MRSARNRTHCPRLLNGWAARPTGSSGWWMRASGSGCCRKSGGMYANTPVAATYLCRSSPRRLTGYLNWSNGYMWQLWSHLEDAVRDGSHRWQQAFGWDGPIFSHFFKSEDTKREFLIGMHGFGLISSPHVVNAFDLSRYQHVGRPGRSDRAPGDRRVRALAEFDGRGVRPAGCRAAGGGDCRPVAGAGPRADRRRRLLCRSAAAGRCVRSGPHRARLDRGQDRRPARSGFTSALPPGGAILIAEKLLHDDKTGPRWAQMQSLNMLTCTEGKERTLGEYEELLVRAGFTDVRGVRTPSPLDAVMAVKRGA